MVIVFEPLAITPGPPLEHLVHDQQACLRIPLFSRIPLAAHIIWGACGCAAGSGMAVCTGLVCKPLLHPVQHDCIKLSMWCNSVAACWAGTLSGSNVCTSLTVLLEKSAAMCLHTNAQATTTVSFLLSSNGLMAVALLLNASQLTWLLELA